jgi:SAM-dependent methyltransferase
MAFSPQVAQPSGSLVACPDSPWNGKVFWVNDGWRRWMPSVEHLACYGFSLAQTNQVTGAELEAYRNGGQVPKIWPAQEFLLPSTQKSVDLREIAVANLQGSGIEFGAGGNPMPVPLGCQVKFADFLPYDEVRRRKYEAAGDDFVPLDYVMSLADPYLVQDGSLDFIIGAHVIEHVENPLKAFEQAYRKLKPGGQFVLGIPDASRSFDRGRPLTTLEHLIADFDHPDEARDREHYVEFFTHVLGSADSERWRSYYAQAFGITEPGLRDFVEHAAAIKADAHLHTWDYASFGELVRLVRQRDPWSSVWSHPGGMELAEFYYVLAK